MMLIRRGTPSVVLAPMEGVADAPMRALLTAQGGYTLAVTEFVRVSQDVIPKKVFVRHCGELLNQSRTPSGVPISVQLLGGHAGRLAASAAQAAELGAAGIDLNFGCPAATVNRHDGGATLLKYPERIEEIVREVRSAVPLHIPVSAKLRLGWEDMNAIDENAERAVRGGASWITIHARTKMQGYRPPAHWQYIARVRAALPVPVIANGEMWTVEDFKRCHEVTGCEHFMLGRGALFDPYLARKVARVLGLPVAQTSDLKMEGDPWLYPESWYPLFSEFRAALAKESNSDAYIIRKMKQWLSFARMRRPLPWFDVVKRYQTWAEFEAFFRAEYFPLALTPESPSCLEAS